MAPKAYMVVDRNWDSTKRLDLAANPGAYSLWKNRAVGHLAKGRPDVKRLLAWAERQTSEITEV